MRAGGGVPEAAGVGADLVGQHDGAVGQAAELQLEVDEADIEFLADIGQDVVDPEGIGVDGVDLLFRVARPRARAW